MTKLEKIGKHPFVPMAIDLIQMTEGKFKMPEIRVWVHSNTGSDYYQIFDSFKEAFEFIEKHKSEAENIPLVAIGGYELNIFDIGQLKPEKKSEKVKESKRDSRIPEIGGYNPELDEG